MADLNEIWGIDERLPQQGRIPTEWETNQLVADLLDQFDPEKTFRVWTAESPVTLAELAAAEKTNSPLERQELKGARKNAWLSGSPKQIIDKNT